MFLKILNLRIFDFFLGKLDLVTLIKLLEVFLALLTANLETVHKYLGKIFL